VVYLWPVKFIKTRHQCINEGFYIIETAATTGGNWAIVGGPDNINTLVYLDDKSFDKNLEDHIVFQGGNIFAVKGEIIPDERPVEVRDSSTFRVTEWEIVDIVERDPSWSIWVLLYPCWWLIKADY
jgi:hypothetical protein